jgi:hypothetical protein
MKQGKGLGSDVCVIQQQLKFYSQELTGRSRPTGYLLFFDNERAVLAVSSTKEGKLMLT